MLAEALSVNPYGGSVIACADIKNHFVASPFLRNIKLATIPAAFAKIEISDTRKLAFAAEGYNYFFGERFCFCKPSRLAADGAVGFVFPFSVEADPIFSYKLRARILGARNDFFHFLIPFKSFATSIRSQPRKADIPDA